MSGKAERIEVIEVDSAEWTAFVETSPQASLFVSPQFLADTGGRATFLLALRRGLPVAGSIYANREPGRHWFQYHSLVLSPEEHSRALRGSFSHTSAAGALFRRTIEENPSGCRFSFHPSIVDLRALNWLFDELGHHPAWKTRFTGHVDLPVARVRGTLGRLVRRGMTLGFETTVTTDSRDLIDVLAQSGISEVRRDLHWIDATARHLIARGIARILSVRSASDKQTRGASLVVDWCDTAHVMFGGVCGEALERRYAGPLRDDYILRCATQSGFRIVDLMGMEGCPRAEYKSGWTSRLVSWLELEWCAR